MNDEIYLINLWEMLVCGGKLILYCLMKDYILEIKEIVSDKINLIKNLFEVDYLKLRQQNKEFIEIIF